MQNHVDRMESHSRQLELKIKNYADQSKNIHTPVVKPCNSCHSHLSPLCCGYTAIHWYENVVLLFISLSICSSVENKSVLSLLLPFFTCYDL